MARPAEKLVCVACSIFRDELEVLLKAGGFDLAMRYVDSRLHVYPEELKEELDRIVEEERARHRKVLLLFGDCHAHMLDYSTGPGIVRVEGVNCCEVFLGAAEYKRMRREGAFFLLPEWTARWREVLPAAIGLNDEDTREMMGELHTKLVYVDTGQQEIPHETLAEVTEYAGLPYEVLSIGLDHLNAALQAAIERLATDAAE